jgi:hypothetical protein|uniref:Uncharacterized protein n=1 Tax=Myoviridae sp. ctshb19 TaxID=2825194 RepID=A0A8S5UGY2_9CAUD|nr:MAG TPA: hypothetical protein [Myoviridae sp. ctshb19]
MAIIFADDFKQWPTSVSGWSTGDIFAVLNATSAASHQGEVQAMGYYPPACTLGGTGDASRLRTVCYSTSKQALGIEHNRTTATYSAGASGLRRAINYSGDTLYFGMVFEFMSAGLYPGNFLFFGPNVAALADLTQTEALLESSFTHTVGIDAEGIFTFNGSPVGVQSNYAPTTVKFYLDVVFKPDVVEFWINDVMVYTESNSNLKIREFAISKYKFPTTAGTGLWVYSLALADNTEGYGQRFGRKTVRTQQVQTITSTLTKNANPAATTELALIRKCADNIAAETGGSMLGNLSAPDGYVGFDFTVPGFTGSEVVYGAAIQVQAKRLAPSGNGLGIRPYATVAGNKKWGSVNLTSSTWKQYAMEVPVTDVPKATTTFGLMFDYAETQKIYVSDQQKIEVYGEPEPSQTTGYLGEILYDLKSVANTAYQSVAPEYMQQTLDTSVYTVNPTEWSADVFPYGQQTMTTAMYDVTNTAYNIEE